MIEKKIKKILKGIERENNISIIFAIESGSRLWGMESKDSDFDVRFCFVQQRDNYLSLGADKNMGKVIIKQEGELDIVGYDIFKFCKLLYKSNPSVIEWLMSDILYYGKIPESLKKLAEKHFSPIALYYHYKNMARGNYEKYIKSNKKVTLKKYLYVLRGIINAYVVKHFEGIPPTNFETALWMMGQEHFGGKGPIKQDILDDITTLIQKKKEGMELAVWKGIIPRDEFIETFLNSKEPKGMKANFTMDKELIEKELKNIIKCTEK